MRRTNWLTTVAVVAILLAPMGSAVAQGSAVAPAVARALPAAGSPAPAQPEEKLSFRLRALAGSAQLRAANAAVQAQALSLPASGAGSLRKDRQGRLLVDIRVGAGQVTETNLDAIRNSGAVIVHVAAQYRIIAAFVAAGDLIHVAELESVENLDEVLTPEIGGAMSRPRGSSMQSPTPSCPGPGGSVVSEGDIQLHAKLARSTYSVDGSGVKVGILSDSYDTNGTLPTNAAQDVASGDLPGPGNPCGYLTPVHVTDSVFSQSDEGRAMLQIVHDLAPGAALAFAPALDSDIFAYADNIRGLRAWGADIIADDVYYFVDPMYQEGPISVAISDVVGAGAVYFTLAGNHNHVISGTTNVGSYETAAYRPAPVPAYLPGVGNSCHDFNPSPTITDTNYAVTLAPFGQVQLDVQWAQPWYSVTTNLDVYVTDISNTVVVSSTDVNTGMAGTHWPFEFLFWDNPTGSQNSFYIHVCRTAAGGGDSGAPRFKWIMLQATQGLTGVEYATSNGGDVIGPTLYGHSSSLHALSVAATPYFDDNNPETYSSFGPATLYFGPILNATPAAAISPHLIQQPDFTATAGGCNTFFGLFVSISCYRFNGTSAATPHAAAVAALLKQKSNQIGFPFNRATVRSLLQTTARSMSGGTLNSVGAGLIDALAAMQREISTAVHLYLPLLRR